MKVHVKSVMFERLVKSQQVLVGPDSSTSLTFDGNAGSGRVW